MKRNMWRPDGWENPNSRYMETDNGVCSNPEWEEFEAGFEAGADAMLKALNSIECSIQCNGGTMLIAPAFEWPQTEGKWIKGKFVFIPDEEKYEKS